MALRPASVNLLFSGGIDVGRDRKTVAPVKLLDLQNAVFTQDTTLIKRTGYRKLGQTLEVGGGNYSGAVALGSRDSELILFTSGSGVLSYRPTADRWASAGTPLSIVARERALAKTGTEQSQADAGGQNNVTVAAWVDNRGGIWWEAVEESTARVLVPPAQLATTGTSPRVVPTGSAQIHIYWADHAAHQLWVAVVDTANPTTALVPAVLVNDLTPTNIGYDVCATTADTVLGGSTPIAPVGIVWVSDAGATRMGYVAPTGVIGSPVSNLPAPVTVAFSPSSNTNPGIAYSAAQGLAFIAFTNTPATINAQVYNLALTVNTFSATGAVAGLGATTRSVSCGWSGTKLYAVIEDTTGAASERDTRVWSFSLDTASGFTVALASTPFPLRGLSLASRLFVDNGIPYAYTVHDVPFFSVYLLVRITDGVVVARTMPTAAHGTQVNGTSIWFATASVDPTSARKWRIPLLYNEQLAALAGQFSETGIRWVTLDFANANAWQSEQLGRGLYLAGACPYHYDGDRWAEWGFHYAPDGTITATPVAGSGALTVGTYTYQIWYEETDAQGEVHRGPTSVGTAVTLAVGAQNEVSITGPMYRLATRRRVRVCIARAVVNNATGFFAVTSFDPTTAGTANGYITNDPTTDTWTFTDRMSDTTLLLQTPLYTTDGVLSNDPAAMAGDVIAVGKGRLFWTDPLDPTMFRYSQQLATGFAAEMAEPLRQRLDPKGGAITGLAVMDTSLYPFRETAVNVVGGPGPLPNPTVQPDTFAFSPGDEVTTAAGCTNPRSIASTPDGLLFKSAKGWRVIGRDRKLVDVGQDIRGFDGQGVTAATLIPGFNRILTLTGDATGSALLFDYQKGQWSRFTNHVGQDAIIFGGLYYYLRSDGRVFVETPGLYRDDNSHIPMVIEMAWLKMTGYLQGWQQIWYAQFVGEYKSAHTLRVRFRLNYELQWSAPFDLDVDNNFTATVYGAGPYGAGPFGSTGSSVYQRRIHVGKPCEAIQFQIQDVEATSSFGAAFELSELVLTGGIKGPLYKLEAARQN